MVYEFASMVWELKQLTYLDDSDDTVIKKKEGTKSRMHSAPDDAFRVLSPSCGLVLYLISH